LQRAVILATTVHAVQPQTQKLLRGIIIQPKFGSSAKPRKRPVDPQVSVLKAVITQRVNCAAVGKFKAINALGRSS
jgi:hypothetical protein